MMGTHDPDASDMHTPDAPSPLATPAIRVTDLDGAQTNNAEAQRAAVDNSVIDKETQAGPSYSASDPAPLTTTTSDPPPPAIKLQKPPQAARRRRKKPNHITFTVSTDSEEDQNATEPPTPSRASDPERGSSTEHVNGNGKFAGDGVGKVESPRSVERDKYPPNAASDSHRGKDGVVKENKKKPSAPVRLFHRIAALPTFSWIKPKMNLTALKPVIRSALSMWLGYVFIMIHPVGVAMGMAAFIVLILACMVPPSAPFVQYVEILCNLFFYQALAWAWCAIGIAIAHATRTPTDPGVVAAAMAKYANEGAQMQALKVNFDATFLQARPAVVCCVWLCTGTAALLWWKMRTAPSPATFPLVFGCITIDVSLTIVPLFPNAYYMAPFLVIKPLLIQSALALLCSILVLPQSVTGQFRSRFLGVLDPLHKSMCDIESLFSDASTMESFGERYMEASYQEGQHVPNYDDPGNIQGKVKEWGDRSDEIRAVLRQSLVGMQPLQAQQRYLDIDISYGRLSGRDLKEIFNILASVQARASAFSFFFNTIVNKARRTHLDSKGFSAHRTMSMATMSRPASRVNISRPGSRVTSAISLKDMARRSSEMLDHGDTPSRPTTPATPTHVTFGHDDSTAPGTPEESEDEQHHGERGRKQQRHHHMHLHDNIAMRLLHHQHRSRDESRERSTSRNRKEKKKHREGSQQASVKGSAVSLIDQLRKVQQPVGVYETQRYMDLETMEARDMDRLIDQLELLSKGALPLVRALRRALNVAVIWTKTSDRKRLDMERDIPKAVSVLRLVLEEYNDHRREVTTPYRHLFDPAHHRDSSHDMSRKQYRGLFYCFVAQYHLMEFADALLRFLDAIVAKDLKRQKRRLWLPNILKLIHQFRASVQRDHAEGSDETEDANYEHEEEDPHWADTLTQVKRRNPDFKPFTNPAMVLLSKLSYIPDVLFSRSAMFAVKAGVLGCLMSLPAFLSSSARFYYYNRGIWATIMAQMTLAVFAGDTFVSWISRLLASFWGGIAGIVAWYIGSGSGNGNPYGLAVVTAFVFPALMMLRIHWPGPVLTSVVFTTSVCLVLGYSYMNGHLLRMTNATWGFDVGWLRFVCVVIGITSAWIFSMVPPSYSAKRAIRFAYARSIANVGHILCEELSAANDPHGSLDMAFNQRVRGQVLDNRAKLTKLGIRHRNAKSELSLRGQWPVEAYEGLLNTLVEIMSLLSQFNHLLPQMPPNWRKALLIRTRMSDPLFIGDVLAVISMASSALRAGTPLPQITPGPLIAKYHLNRFKGLDLPKDPAEQHEDMPTLVTVEVLESDDYMRYALGVSTIYALMSRLDAVVVLCKTLLGENYHIANLRVVDTIPTSMA